MRLQRRTDHNSASTGHRGAQWTLAAGFLGAVVAVAILDQGWRYVVADPVESAFWILFISLGAMLCVSVLPRLRVDATFNAPVLVAAAVLLEPVHALIVATSALYSPKEFRSGLAGSSRIFNHAQTGLATWLAATAVTPIVTASSTPRLIAGAAVSALVYYSANVLFVSLAAVALGRASIRVAVRAAVKPVPRYLETITAVMLLSALVVVLYLEVRFFTPLLLALPVWLGYRLVKELRISRSRVRELEVLNELGRRLAEARLAEYACQVTEAVLSEALSGEVSCSAGGAVPEGHLAVPVPECNPVVLTAPRDLDGYHELLKAAATTLGEVLRRLEAEHETERILLKQSGLADRLLSESMARRMTVAHDLEDDALQHLVAGLIQLENVRAAARLERYDLVENHAVKSRDTLDNAFRKGKAAIDALRDAANLSDDEVYDLDIGEMLTRVAEGLHYDTLMRCNVDLGDPPAKLPPLMTIATVQVAKSCLEAAAYAGANQADLQIGVNGNLDLRVRSQPGGFGQPPRAMLNRVHLAGGRVTIEHEEGGDVLCAVIPLVGRRREAAG
jgi:signal transduction histidine kinase